MDRMKDYRQLIKELPSNTFVCALGEFNPPTIAHELLVKTVKVVAEHRRADHTIYTSPSELINEEKKANFLQLMFPKTKFQSLGESFFTSQVKQLSEKYRKVVIVAGADQFAEFKKLKESVNVEIISIGDKDPDADNTKMKQFASKGVYEDFKKLLPSTIRDIDGKRLMNEMRVGMNLEPIKEQLVLVKDKLREKYFKGEIFNEGELVESAGKYFTIVKRGSNHLLLKEESGELVSKWIHDVKPVKQKMKIEEAVIQTNGTDKVEPNTPESDTGAKQEPLPKGKTKGFITFYNYNTKENGDAMQEQRVPVAQSETDDDKDTESDLDTINGKAKVFDPTLVGHTLTQSGTAHNVRRMKVRYTNVNEQIIGTQHTGSMHHTKTPSTDKFHDKEAKAKMRAQLALKHAREKENLSHKHEKEKAALQNEAVLDKPTPSVEEIAKKHKVDVTEIQQQVKIGAKIEHEHATAEKTAEEIARDHLSEKPDYYKKLKQYVESVLNPNDPHGDYAAKRKALHDLSLDKNVDQKAVQQRRLDLDKEYEKFKESLDEAKKKPVCPVCGKHECICDKNDQIDQTQLRPTFDPFFKEQTDFDLTDEEIDKMVESVTDEEIEELYEENEITLVYEDTGEEVEPHPEEYKLDLMEVLSRAERLKGKIRLRKTAAKRSRSTKIALKRYSDPKTINKRARRLAIKLMKQRMLRGRNPSKISIGEKERIEKILHQRKDMINRVAQKLVARVRKVEKARMSHGKVTKGAMPSVF